MLDGINLVCHGFDPSVWYDAPELQGVDGFPLEVIEQTGEVLKRPRKARYKGLTFAVSPSQNGGVRCYVDGSIHKYKNNGLHNYDGFKMADIQAVVSDLQTRFGLDPARTYVHGLEIGVNLMMPSNAAVNRVIQAAVAHKDKPYSGWFPRSPVKGKVCCRVEYEIKLYHKGNQSGIKEPILRIEVKVLKMRYLDGYGLETLADLINPTKVTALIEVLKDVLRYTVFIDPFADMSGLTDKQRLSLEMYKQSERWNKLDFKQRLAQNRHLERLLEKCNVFAIRADLEKRLLKEWENLNFWRKEAEKMAMISPTFSSKEAVEIAMFSPLECVGENIAIAMSNQEHEKQEFGLSTKRVCCSCGSDISDQRRQSRFCSEKYKGGSAKKCRNKDSNRRKTLKLKIMHAQIRNRYLRITYKKDGVPYTDTLHSSEIVVSREWLDTVVSVEVVPIYSSDEKESFDGKGARAVLEELTRENASGEWVDGG